MKNRLTVTWGYGNKSQRGIRTTKSVKRLGCSILKQLIESQKLLVQDFDTIAELSTFISSGGSYEAEMGSHDDMVMTLVLFSWLTNQEFLTDLTNADFKKKMVEDMAKQMEEESLPSFLAGHEEIDNAENQQFVSDGAVWSVVER